MRANSKLLLLIGFALALTGCARAFQNSTPTKGTVVQHGSGLPGALVSQNSIQGNWKSNCAQDPKTRGYFTAILAIENQVMTVVTTSYADSACAFPIVIETRVSNIAITMASNSASLAETLVTINYEPLNAVMANLFNQNSFCGASNWVSGTSVTVTTPTNCSGVTPILGFHTELYGSTELYLDGCVTPGGTGCAVRYLKVIQ